MDSAVGDSHINRADGVWLVTLERGTLPIYLIKLVQREGEKTIPTLEWGRAYETEHVLSSVWKTLSVYEHKMAGRVLSYLAWHGAIAVRRVGTLSNHHAIYMRTE